MGRHVRLAGGELIGAVGYGFSFAGSKIGGVTPAQDMVNLLGLPSPSARPVPKAVKLDRGLARTVARAAGSSVANASTLGRLRVPLAVSRLDSVGLDLLARNFGHRRADGLVPFVAGSTSSSAALGAPPSAGENFAAALAYGTVSMTAMGTTTYVCGGHAVPELGVDQTATTDLVANDQAGFLTYASMLSVFGTAFDAVGGGFDTAGRGTARVWWTFEGELRRRLLLPARRVLLLGRRDAR